VPPGCSQALPLASSLLDRALRGRYCRLWLGHVVSGFLLLYLSSTKATARRLWLGHVVSGFSLLYLSSTKATASGKRERKRERERERARERAWLKDAPQRHNDGDRQADFSRSRKSCSFDKTDYKLHDATSDRDIVMADAASIAALCTPEVCDVTSHRDIVACDVPSRSGLLATTFPEAGSHVLLTRPITNFTMPHRIAAL